MIKTIFRSTFLVGMSVLLLCAVLFFGLQLVQVNEETRDSLRQESMYAEKGLQAGGKDYLSSLDTEENRTRILWFLPDGEVLFDSEASAPSALSEKDCQSLVSSVSDTDGDVLITGENGMTSVYYVRECTDGTYLCLSRPLSAVTYALVAVSPVLWVIVLVLMISGLLAFRAAKTIVKPINELDPDHPDTCTYPELAPLILRLKEQKLTIQEEETQREDLRREFSANVSHELKTPLTSISGFAELIAQGVVTGEKAQEFSRDILRESDRLVALIDDIIRLSRLDEEAIGPEREPVDLYSLSENVLDSLRPVADRQHVTLTLQGQTAEIPGVYQVLNEMVYNLCDNAIKYNLPGGTVTVTVDPNGPLLTVADTGIGIPEAHQKRVFERFYRVDKSHSREVGGTGLGLSIVKHGALLHNAQVRLKSKVDQGTEITLDFSDTGKDPSRDASEAGSPAAKTPGETAR